VLFAIMRVLRLAVGIQRQAPEYFWFLSSEQSDHKGEITGGDGDG
jgi:hypothetical protein